MDPLTAFGLAGNIVQFIDFAVSLIFRAHERYKSANEGVDEHRDISRIATDLEGVTSKLSISVLPFTAATVLTEDDQAFVALYACYLNVAAELGTAFSKVGFSSTMTKLRSMRQALKIVWRQGRFDVQQLRLDGFLLSLVL